MNWPKKKETAEDVYSENESGKEGFYPVGINNFWHSGIHIPFTPHIKNEPNQVQSLFEGKLVAYRISSDYIEIERPEIISEVEFKNLIIESRRYYEEDNKNGVVRYKLIESEHIPNLRFSTNFAIVKHSLSLSGNDGKKLEFFTLYMNLLPDSKYQMTQYFDDDFQPINGEFPESLPSDYFIEQTPFYRKWKFKTDHLDYFDNKYYLQNGIFPLSHFTILNSNIFHRNHEITQYKAKFINGDKELDIPVEDAEILDQRIMVKPKTSDTAFYRTITPDFDKKEGHKISVLLQDEQFEVVNDNFSSEHWTNRNNYITISLNQSQIDQEKTHLKGWINKAAFKTNAYSSLKLYQQHNIPEDIGFANRDFYNIDEYNSSDHGSDVFKIVKFRTYLEYIAGRTVYYPNSDYIEEYDTFVTKFIAYNNEQSADIDGISGAAPVVEQVSEYDTRLVLLFNKDKYLLFNQVRYSETVFDFYFKGTKIDVIQVGRKVFRDLGDERSSLNPYMQSSISNRLKVLVIEKYLDLYPEEEVKETDAPFGSALFADEQDDWLYCRYYVDRYTNSNRIVNAEDFDLVSGPKARIKRQADISNTDNLKDADDGLFLFDNPGATIDGIDTGNVSSILPIDTIFELHETDDFVYNFTDGFFHIKTNDDSEEYNKYIYLPTRGRILAKSVIKKDFEINDSVVVPDKEININNSTTIGYPALNSNGLKRYFDLVLFAPDVSVMDEFNTDKKVERYIIPPEQELKTAIENESDFSQFFPGNTDFDILETQEFGESISYHLKLRAINIYIRNSDRSTELSTEQKASNEGDDLCQITKPPGRIWLRGTSIIYNDTSDEEESSESEVTITCSATVRPFAEAFKEVREALKGMVLNRMRRGDGGDKFRIDFSHPDLDIDFNFWVFPSNLPEGYTIENNIISTTNSSFTTNGFSGNPLEVEFVPFARKGKQIGSLYLWDPVINRKCRSSGELYSGFNLQENKIVYIPESTVDGYKKDLLNWVDFFTKVEEDSSTANDIFCDIREQVIDKIEITAGDSDRVTDPNGRLSGKELSDIFNSRALPHNRSIIEELRKLVCKHPLEWDKELYKDLGAKLTEKFGPGHTQQQIEHIESVGNQLDIWEDISKVDGMPSSNSFWFAHPVYFCKHLKRTGILEVNPFFNKDVYRGVSSLLGVDNPGFAPISNNAISEFVMFNGKYVYLANGRFNADFKTANISRKPGDYRYYWHEGVDFSAPLGTNIVSFIYGTVIGGKLSGKWSEAQQKYTSGMGGCLTIQNDRNKEIFYVLVHLLDWQMVNEGDKISPGDIIATVGKPFAVPGPHLHLSKIIQKDDYPVAFNGKNFPWWQPRLSPGNADDRKILNAVVNPFKHSETWKGRWEN